MALLLSHFRYASVSVVIMAMAACDRTTPSEARAPAVAPAPSIAANSPPIITDESQRDAAVGRDVVTDADNMSANRGNGTFYSVVDPATGRLAKPSLAE